MKKPEGLEKVKYLINEFKNQKHEIFLVSPEIYNAISFLDVLTFCTEGKNELTESKVQGSFLDIQNVCNLLKIVETCWPLKEVVLGYLFEAFLSTEWYDSFIDKEDIKLMQNMMEIILNDIEYLVS